MILTGIIIFLFSFVLGKIGKFFVIKKVYKIKKFDLISFLIAFVLWEPLIMLVCYMLSIDFKKNKEERIRELTVLNQFTENTKYELASIIFKPQYLYFMFEDAKDEITKDMYDLCLKIKKNRKNRKKILLQQIKRETNFRINNLNLQRA